MPEPDCPTAEELYPAIVMLLPPGEAWPARESPKSETVQASFWTAVSKEIGRMEGAFCQVWREMFAHTAATEDPDNEAWLTEMGLPAANDAFGDNFLAKLRAVGSDGSAAYYARLAEELGWSIEADWQAPSTLHLTIDESASPALSGFLLPAVGISHVGGPGNYLGVAPAVGDLINSLYTVLPGDAVITYTVV